MPSPANLVHALSSGTGTGDLAISDAFGKQSFDAAFGHGSTTDVFDYFISHRTAAEWEQGTGHLSDAGTLVRDTVIESSNGNAAVDFSAGVKDITNDVPASGRILKGNRTAIKSLNTNATTAVYLTESGREGMFVWRTGNFSTLIAADPQEGVYIKANAVAASSGAWVRVFDGDMLSILWFGADPTGTNDSKTAVQAAFTLGAAYSTYYPSVLAPAGRYKISTSVTLPTKTALIGAGRNATIFIPGMTDGSGCFTTTGGVQSLTLRGFQIAGTWTAGFESWKAGSGTAQNCIGVDLRCGSSWLTRFKIEDIRITGCSVGMNLDGFIGVIDNLYIAYCDTGFIGTTFNNVTLNGLLTEWNRKAFAIDGGDCITFNGLLSEWEGVQNTAAATIDNANNVVLNAPYFERNSSSTNTEPFLVFGGTTRCTGVTVLNAKVTGAEEVSLIRFDRVTTGYARAWGANRVNVLFETTENCIDVDVYVVSLNGGNNHDNSLVIDQAVNYWPNPRFDLWLRGWDSITATNATFAKETTLVRRGANALKITATSGTTFNNVAIRINDIAHLRGKTVRVGSWAWIPDIDEYQNNDGTGAMPKYPGLLLQSNNGSATVSSSTRNNKTARGQWNFMWNEVTMQADATSLIVSLYANQSSNAANGNEWIVVDSISVVDSRVPLQRQMRGELLDGPNLPRVVGNRIEMYRDTPPNDSDLIYVAGDKCWKQTPAAGGSPGSICTTGGAGDVVVWEPISAYDPDTLKADTSDDLTAGFTSTSFSAGTKSSGTFTPVFANGNVQDCTNGGAFALGVPSGHGSMILDITNNGSAGAITTSAYTKKTGDSFDTTNAHVFRCYITTGNAGSHLHVQAMF